MYLIKLKKNAQSDAVRIERANLKKQVFEIMKTVRQYPFDPAQQFEKISLNKNLTIYTRRINRQHRFVYTLSPNTEMLKDQNGELYEGIVYVHRMWGHYP